MKLILANNQSKKFRDFFAELAAKSAVPFDYAGYSSLLFEFNPAVKPFVDAYCLSTGRKLSDYDGVYINGYLNTYELAATVAIACKAHSIGFANSELAEPPSLSKLSMYAKLAEAGISIPRSFGGSKQAMMKATEQLQSLGFPAVLKRADADRGIDNYKVDSLQAVLALLKPHAGRSLWILQELVPNDGFYLVSFNNGQPSFCIYRKLEARPDGNQQKAHMYKPRGGTNATLVKIADAPPLLLQTCQRAVQAMKRQIASVDCLYDEKTQKVHVLEVNYNPQLVTIETFRAQRIAAFLSNLESLG